MSSKKKGLVKAKRVKRKKPKNTIISHNNSIGNNATTKANYSAKRTLTKHGITIKAKLATTLQGTIINVHQIYRKKT